jgi:uncharacterized damage-inducible protein DinB
MPADVFGGSGFPDDGHELVKKGRPGSTMSQALRELFRGQGAHADPIACMEDVHSTLANRRIERFPHSIGDLVYHMNYWLDYELRRIRGEKPKYPAHNAESFSSSDCTPEDWERRKSEFVRLLAEFARLAEAPQADLLRQIESAHEADRKVAGTQEAVLWQMVAHTSYHVGQIALIRRTLNAWPPRAGGDTW